MKHKQKILLTRRLHNFALNELKRKYDVTVHSGKIPMPKKILMRKVQDKDGLICFPYDIIDSDVVKSGKKLKCISTYSVGFDHIDIKFAKKIVDDYQHRRLFKCVFESDFNNKTKLGKKRLDQIKQDIARKSKVDENEIFVDSSTTPSMPLSPSKKESNSIILITNNGKKTEATKIPISKIPIVSTMSGFMNNLRVYTPAKNRKKVEIAAKSVIR